MTPQCTAGLNSVCFQLIAKSRFPRLPGCRGHHTSEDPEHSGPWRFTRGVLWPQSDQPDSPFRPKTAKQPSRTALVLQEVPPLKPTRDLKYLAWIRTLPCLVCGRTGGIEAAHTGPHGIGQKSPDTSAVPLCAIHHRTGRDSYHKLGPRAFERHHGLDLRAIVARLNEKPSIRVEFGSFVGRYRDEDFMLGLLQVGLRPAVQNMLSIKQEDCVSAIRGEHSGLTVRDYFRVRERLQARV